jgi:hypothetical protein
MIIMYSWTALSGRTNEAVVGLGITPSHEKAKLDAEELLRDGKAFLAVIETVRPVMAAHSLSPCYLRTGAAWLGRRNNSGGVAWRHFYVEDGDDRIDL